MICEDLIGMRVLITGASSGIGPAQKRSSKENSLRQERHRQGRRKTIPFLASDAASFITSEYIAVNGDLYTRA
jgi:NAD(P)-dependent dehydrogenase (short-subunit alcohol dehydrogenase family)